MAFFDRRPLCAAAVLFILSATAGFFLPWKVRLFCMIVALTVIVALVAFRLACLLSAAFLRRCLILLVVLILSFGEGVLYDRLRLSVPEFLAAREDAVVITAVVIRREYDSSYESRFVIITDGIGGEDIRRKAVFVIPDGSDLQPGYRFDATVRLTDWEKDGTRREDLNAVADGIAFKLTAVEDSDVTVLEENVYIPGTGFRRFNERIVAGLDVSLGRDVGRLTGALLLGRRDRLDRNVIRDFGRCGVSHLLALSGMHVSILIGSLGWLLERMRIPRAVRIPVTFGCAVLFLLVTGVSLSALRCVVMLGLLDLAFFLAADNDPPTTLCTAVALIVAINPASALDVSLWMSFLATFAIVVVSPLQNALSDRMIVRGKGRPLFLLTKGLCGLCQGIVISLAATFWTLPLTWLLFGQVSLATALMTLVLLPGTYCLLIGGVVLAAVSLIDPAPFGAVGGALVTGMRFVGTKMLDLTKAVSGWRNVVVSLRYGFAVWIVLPLTLCLVAGLIVRLRHRITALIPPAAALIAFVAVLMIRNQILSGIVGLTIFPGGDSDVLLLEDAGYAMIVDFSDGSYASYAEAVEAAEEQGHTQIDVCMLTRYNRRLIGSLQKVFERTVVRELWVPKPVTEDEYYFLKSIEDGARYAGVAVSVFEPGDGMRVFGTGRITLLGRSTAAGSTRSTEIVEVLLGDTKLVCLSRGALAPTSPLYETARRSVTEYDVIWFCDHGPIPGMETDVAFDGTSGIEVWISEAGLIRWSDYTAASFPSDASARLIRTAEPFRAQYRLEPKKQNSD